MTRDANNFACNIDAAKNQRQRTSRKMSREETIPTMRPMLLAPRLAAAATRKANSRRADREMRRVPPKRVPSRALPKKVYDLCCTRLKSTSQRGTAVPRHTEWGGHASVGYMKTANGPSRTLSREFGTRQMRIAVLIMSSRKLSPKNSKTLFS